MGAHLTLSRGNVMDGRQKSESCKGVVETKLIFSGSVLLFISGSILTDMWT